MSALVLVARLVTACLTLGTLAMLAWGWWIDRESRRGRVSERTPEEEITGAVERWATAAEAAAAAGAEVQAQRASEEAAAAQVAPEEEVELT